MAPVKLSLCPGEDYIYLEETEQCYLPRVQSSYLWEDASEFCENSNGYLVSDHACVFFFV